MKKLPDVIADVLGRIRSELGSNISVSRLNGHYYVYRRSTVWDKDKKRVKSIAEYLGRITDGGTFIRKGPLQSAAFERPVPLVAEQLNDTDRKILTALSMNSRASLSLIGRIAGLKPNSVHYRVNQLEERYRIKYITENNLVKLGYLEYLALIRFVGKRPDVGKLREAFSAIPNVQLVLLTSGRYDMVVHFVAKSNDPDSNSLTTFYKFQTDKTIGEYEMEWVVSPFYSGYCFVPLRQEFYKLLEEKIWRRSKETPRILPDQITSREYAVLKEMNSSSNIDFTEIDKRHKFDRGTARYTYHRLRESGRIIRPTMSMRSTGARYNAVFLANIVNGKQMSESRKNLLSEIIGETQNPTSKYALVGNSGAPAGAVLVCPIFKEGELQKIEGNFIEKLKGFELVTLIVTEVLVGELCYRLFDNMHSGQYNRIIEDYRRDLPQNKINYEESASDRKIVETEEGRLPEENQTD